LVTEKPVSFIEMVVMEHLNHFSFGLAERKVS